MTAFATFGDPARFEIAVRWIDDTEPRERRPRNGGWSAGEVRLTIRHQVITRYNRNDTFTDAIAWYLLPLFEWFADNWVALLHEERFAWAENSAAPAAIAASMALRRTIDAEDTAGQETYAAVQGWWSRHALRAADSSALYPDMMIRRLSDDIEISWTARQPSFPPDGYRLALAPGAATLGVKDVAEPLWEALAWVGVNAPTANAEDRASVAALEQKLARLRDVPLSALESGYLATGLAERVASVRTMCGLPDTSTRMQSVPAITKFDDAVLMFGGVRPDLGSADIEALAWFLSSCKGGSEQMALSILVDPGVGAPLTAPFDEGYDLAEALLEQLGLPGDATAIDIRRILSDLGVTVEEIRLQTTTIRGVALAGVDYRPSILLNMTSRYNALPVGQRFTLAHELFHILYDRGRARRLAHVSGAWACPGVEKRANAFAAMLLMPRDLVRRSLPETLITPDAVARAANIMQVSISALVEHLYNIGKIDECERDELREQFRAVKV